MNHKKIAAIVLFGLTMTACPTPANGQSINITYQSKTTNNNVLSFLKEALAKQTMLEEEAARVETLKNNTISMNLALKKLNSYVGKTWYAFSGSTPAGWDCSGMTMWFYEQQGVSLEHRATKQAKAGTSVESPKLGDIVVFSYKVYSSAYHVGIYVGNGKMIHAPKRGHVTRIEDVATFGGNYSKVDYRRVLETN